MKDYELSPERLQKRVGKWKDNTLLNRLAAYGYQHYTPKNKKKIRTGQASIPERTRKQLEKKYERLVKTQPPPPPRKPKERPIGGSSGSWMRIEDYVNGINRPELDKEFTLNRLTGRRFAWVYNQGRRVVFTNQRINGPPIQPNPSPQFVIYEVTVEDDQISSWMQASQSAYFGPDPLGTGERAMAEEEVGYMEQRNKEMSTKSIPSNEVYTWWNQGAVGSTYSFVGIGVYL